MRESRLRILVTGYVGQYPLGGVAWDYLQFVLGLKDLGHEVFYIEDTGLWPYDPRVGGLGDGCEFTVSYLQDVMSHFGLEDRWAYRFDWASEWYGLPEAKRTRVLSTADVLFNVSGSLGRPWELGHVPTRIYFDTDPVFTQLKLIGGNSQLRQQVDAHNRHYTVGELLPGTTGAETGHDWRPARHPIVLSEWITDLEPGSTYSTIMNWTSYKDLVHEGQTYGQKDVEFMKFLDVPGAVTPNFELAVAGGKTRRVPTELLEHRGWSLSDPDVVCSDHAAYRNFIQRARGEWSVAKNGYVVGRSGWFSGRSAAYLASGRPVILQDTGYSECFPVGEGVLHFDDFDSAVGAIELVESDYSRHCAAARDIAAAYFGAESVLSGVLDSALSSHG